MPVLIVKKYVREGVNVETVWVRADKTVPADSKLTSLRNFPDNPNLFQKSQQEINEKNIRKNRPSADADGDSVLQ